MTMFEHAATGLRSCARGQGSWCRAAVVGLTAGFTGPLHAGTPPAAGDLVITEIMKNPAVVLDTNGEWFEILNVSANTIELAGLTLDDDGIDNHVISPGGGSLTIAPGARRVLGIDGNGGTNGGVTVDYVYDTFLLANADDEIVILDGAVEIDRVNYTDTDFPDSAGFSLTLDPGTSSAAGNDLGLNWCDATSTYGLGDRGTPGASNDMCIGACCFSDGSCVLIGAGACLDVEGDFHGAETACGVCPPAAACCAPDGACTALTEIACTSIGHAFLGVGTSCATTNCTIPGQVLAEHKISATSGGFGGVLDPSDWFGSSVAALGDLDDDGVSDLAVGAPRDDDGGKGGALSDIGAVWILFLNTDGTVKSHQKISSSSGGFNGALEVGDQFGYSLACLGDLDGDGVADLAVGAWGDDDGEQNAGAVWIVFLENDGTVKAHQKIGAAAGGFGQLNDFWSVSVAALGDVDGDDITDLAVGAGAQDGSGVAGCGAVSILLLNPDGTVKGSQKISSGIGGLSGPLAPDDFFGGAVASLGDLDGDGVIDLAVGADANGGPSSALWILFLEPDGTVKAEQKINAASGGFGGTIAVGDLFAWSLGSIADLDGDGHVDLAVAAPGAPPAGRVWILFLNPDGTVDGEFAIGSGAGGFGGALDPGDFFGHGVTSLGDLDGDGRSDLAVGAASDDDGAANAGAVWILNLDGVPAIQFDPPTVTLAAGAGDLVSVGDLDSDGDQDAVVAIPGDNPLVNGFIQVFLNQGIDGTGGWLGFVTNAPIEVGCQPSGVAVGRFDLDDDLDLAITNACDDNIIILRNSGAGDGAFVFEQTIAVGLEPQAIVSANLNGAGRDDLAVANAGDDNITILSNATAIPGSSVWMPTASIPAGNAPTTLEPEDFEDDKDVDLIVGSLGDIGDGTISYLILDSGAPESTVTVTVGGTPVDLASDDLDGNGFPDTAVAIQSDNTVAIIPNVGAGVFGPPELLAVGIGPTSVELVDLDGDGDPDLVVTAVDPIVGPALQIFENLGPPPPPLLGGATVEFRTPVSYSVGANPNYVVSADIDGDSLPDLVTANDDPEEPTDGSVSVLLTLACQGDHDGSGNVGFGDVTVLLLNWGTCPAPPANCPWDHDHNGTVGFNDLTQLLLHWGACL